MVTKMSGTTERRLNETTCHFSFAELMNMQMDFQADVICDVGYNGLEDRLPIMPIDNVAVASYHNQALMEEVGELIKSDKRWKNYRNEFYDKENKIEELADCFITLMNIAMFSGVSGEKMQVAIAEKIRCNQKRLEDVCKEGFRT